jgi:pimeloyl-ACP methyl ester carboxylesterase
VIRRIVRVAVIVLLAVPAAYGLGRAGIVLWERDSLDRAALKAPGRFIRVDGKRVHILERGAGPPLVLVHGFGGSTFDWEQHTLDLLARDHRVVALDLWGHGFSERQPSPGLDFIAFADQIAAVLSALQIESAVVAGHSMGGGVAAVLAAERPALVERLILVAGVAPAQPNEVPWLFRLLRTPVLGEVGMGLTANLAPPEAPDDYRERMALVSRVQDTRLSLLGYVRRAEKREQLRDAYRRIQAPTLILHGRNDRNVPFASVERVAPLISDATVIPLDGMGHWLLWEAPDRVVEEMNRFLSASADPP